MTANRVELYHRLRALWPDLHLANRLAHGHVWFSDNQYDCPKSDQAPRLIHWRKPWQFWVQPAYLAEKHDCDDLALRMTYEVQQAYAGKNPLAFGMIDLVNGVLSHRTNILICEDTILMYDWQTDCIRRASSDADWPYFVLI